MEITRNGVETRPGPADWFTGTVYVDAVAMPSGASRLSANSVHFTPGARTAETAAAPAVSAGPRRTTHAGSRPARARATEATGPWSAEATRSRRPARPAVVPGAGFADSQRTTHEQLAVELLDGGFRLRALGVPIAGAADVLGISLTTAKRELRAIHDKLGATCDADIYRDLGWLVVP